MNKNKWLKFTAGVLVFLFVFNDVSRAAPAIDLSAAFRNETPRISHIDIPPELATLDDWYESKTAGDSRLMLHIQDAHAQPEAQARIRDLIHFLHDKYGFKTVFVEGAAEPLDVKWLNPFTNAEDNKKWVEHKTASGELSGVDLALLDGMTDLKTLPIETIEGYREGYLKLRAVYTAQSEVKSFLDFYESKLDLIALKILDEKTRTLLGEWRKFEAGHRDFLPFLNHLTSNAKSVLNIDFGVLYSQIEWPQITRLLVLQDLEKKLSQPAAQRSSPNALRSDESSALSVRQDAEVDRQALIHLMNTKGTRRELVEALKKLDEQHVNLNRITIGDGKQFSSPRALIEQLVEESRRLEIDLAQYPSFIKYAGYVILSGELNPANLFKEIEKLFNLLIEPTLDQRRIPHAKTTARAELIEFYKDSFILKKLLSLELSRDEWQIALRRKVELEPKRLMIKLKNLSVGKDSLTEESIVSELGSRFVVLGSVFENAFAFYDAALKRENIFFEKIVQGLHAHERAILVTGGFHSDGLKDFFKEQDISYGTLSPRLMKIESSANYRKAMMDTSSFDSATQAVVEHAMRRETRLAMLGLSLPPPSVHLVAPMNALPPGVGPALLNHKIPPSTALRSESRQSIREIVEGYAAIPWVVRNGSIISALFNAVLWSSYLSANSHKWGANKFQDGLVVVASVGILISSFVFTGWRYQVSQPKHRLGQNEVGPGELLQGEHEKFSAETLQKYGVYPTSEERDLISFPKSNTGFQELAVDTVVIDTRKIINPFQVLLSPGARSLSDTYLEITRSPDGLIVPHNLGYPPVATIGKPAIKAAAPAAEKLTGAKNAELESKYNEARKSTSQMELFVIEYLKVKNLKEPSSSWLQGFAKYYAAPKAPNRPFKELVREIEDKAKNGGLKSRSEMRSSLSRRAFLGHAGKAGLGAGLFGLFPQIVRALNPQLQIVRGMNQHTINWNGDPYTMVEIQEADNLTTKNWKTLTTVQADANGRVSYVVNSSKPQNFFRSISPYADPQNSILTNHPDISALYQELVKTLNIMRTAGVPGIPDGMPYNQTPTAATPNLTAQWMRPSDIQAALTSDLLEVLTADQHPTSLSKTALRNRLRDTLQNTINLMNQFELLDTSKPVGQQGTGILPEVLTIRSGGYQKELVNGWLHYSAYDMMLLSVWVELTAEIAKGGIVQGFVDPEIFGLADQIRNRTHYDRFVYAPGLMSRTIEANPNTREFVAALTLDKVDNKNTEARGFLPLMLLGYFGDVDQAVSIWNSMHLNFNYYPATISGATKMIPVPEGDDTMSIFAMLYFFQMMDPAEFANVFGQGALNYFKAATFLTTDIGGQAIKFQAPSTNPNGSYAGHGLESPGMTSPAGLAMAFAASIDGQVNAEALANFKSALQLMIAGGGLNTNGWSLPDAFYPENGAVANQKRILQQSGFTVEFLHTIFIRQMFKLIMQRRPVTYQGQTRSAYDTLLAMGQATDTAHPIPAETTIQDDWMFGYLATVNGRYWYGSSPAPPAGQANSVTTLGNNREIILRYYLTANGQYSAMSQNFWRSGDGGVFKDAAGKTLQIRLGGNKINIGSDAVQNIVDAKLPASLQIELKFWNGTTTLTKIISRPVSPGGLIEIDFRDPAFNGYDRTRFRGLNVVVRYENRGSNPSGQFSIQSMSIFTNPVPFRSEMRLFQRGATGEFDAEFKLKSYARATDLEKIANSQGIIWAKNIVVPDSGIVPFTGRHIPVEDAEIIVRRHYYKVPANYSGGEVQFAVAQSGVPYWMRVSAPKGKKLPATESFLKRVVIRSADKTLEVVASNSQSVAYENVALALRRAIIVKGDVVVTRIPLISNGESAASYKLTVAGQRIYISSPFMKDLPENLMAEIVYQPGKVFQPTEMRLGKYLSEEPQNPESLVFKTLVTFSLRPSSQESGRKTTTPVQFAAYPKTANQPEPRQGIYQQDEWAWLEDHLKKFEVEIRSSAVAAGHDLNQQYEAIVILDKTGTITSVEKVNPRLLDQNPASYLAVVNFITRKITLKGNDFQIQDRRLKYKVFAQLKESLEKRNQLLFGGDGKGSISRSEMREAPSLTAEESQQFMAWVKSLDPEQTDDAKQLAYLAALTFDQSLKRSNLVIIRKIISGLRQLGWNIGAMPVYKNLPAGHGYTDFIRKVIRDSKTQELIRGHAENIILPEFSALRERVAAEAVSPPRFHEIDQFPPFVRSLAKERDASQYIGYLARLIGVSASKTHTSTGKKLIGMLRQRHWRLERLPIWESNYAKFLRQMINLSNSAQLITELSSRLVTGGVQSPPHFESTLPNQSFRVLIEPPLKGKMSRLWIYNPEQKSMTGWHGFQIDVSQESDLQSFADYLARELKGINIATSTRDIVKDAISRAFMSRSKTRDEKEARKIIIRSGNAISQTEEKMKMWFAIGFVVLVALGVGALILKIFFSSEVVRNSHSSAAKIVLGVAAKRSEARSIDEAFVSAIESVYGKGEITNSMIQTLKLLEKRRSAETFEKLMTALGLGMQRDFSNKTLHSPERLAYLLGSASYESLEKIRFLWERAPSRFPFLRGGAHHTLGLGVILSAAAFFILDNWSELYRHFPVNVTFMPYWELYFKYTLTNIYQNNRGLIWFLMTSMPAYGIYLTYWIFAFAKSRDKKADFASEFSRFVMNPNKLADISDSRESVMQNIDGQFFGMRSAMRLADARFAYQAMRKVFFNSLALGDDIGIQPGHIDIKKLVKAFLVLGNPDLQTFLEFAKLWLRIRNETGLSIPIVLAGGIGRGTVPLIRKMIEHYKSLGRLTEAEENHFREAREAVIAYLKADPTTRGNPPITEADVMEFIFTEKEGIDSRMIRRESIPSKNTKANFDNTVKSLQEIAGALSAGQPFTIGVVSAPWLLRRLLPSAANAWTNPDWQAKRVSLYTANPQTDKDLLEMGGYVHGYVDENEARLSSSYPKLNPHAELKGIRDQFDLLQAQGVPAWIPKNAFPNKTDERNLKKARLAFRFYVRALEEENGPLQYYAIENRLVPKRSEIRKLTDPKDFSRKWNAAKDGDWVLVVDDHSMVRETTVEELLKKIKVPIKKAVGVYEAHKIILKEIKAGNGRPVVVTDFSMPVTKPTEGEIEGHINGDVLVKYLAGSPLNYDRIILMSSSPAKWLPTQRNYAAQKLKALEKDPEGFSNMVTQVEKFLARSGTQINLRAEYPQVFQPEIIKLVLKNDPLFGGFTERELEILRTRTFAESPETLAGLAWQYDVNSELIRQAEIKAFKKILIQSGRFSGTKKPRALTKEDAVFLLGGLAGNIPTALNNANITTIAQLLEKTGAEMRKWRNFGEVGIQRLNERLEFNGFPQLRRSEMRLAQPGIKQIQETPINVAPDVRNRLEAARYENVSKLDFTALSLQEAVTIIAHGLADAFITIEAQIKILMNLAVAAGPEGIEALRLKLQTENPNVWNALSATLSKQASVYRILTVSDLNNSEIRNALLNAMKAMWLINPKQQFHFVGIGKDADVVAAKQAMDQDLKIWSAKLRMKTQLIYSISSAVSVPRAILNIEHRVERVKNFYVVSSFNMEQGVDQSNALFVNEELGNQVSAELHQVALFKLAQLSQNGSPVLDSIPEGFEPDPNRIGGIKMTAGSLAAVMKSILDDLRAAIQIAIAA